jgi:hypothetical protein
MDDATLNWIEEQRYAQDLARITDANPDVVPELFHSKALAAHALGRGLDYALALYQEEEAFRANRAAPPAQAVERPKPTTIAEAVRELVAARGLR